MASHTWISSCCLHEVVDGNPVQKGVLNSKWHLLLQFLPQDKVVEFARMDQYELLVATEKAIGDASLYETHQKLIAQRNTVKDKESVS